MHCAGGESQAVFQVRDFSDLSIRFFAKDRSVPDGAASLATFPGARFSSAKAFSSEVDTGSREENASNKK
jgi:hypothetical protein